MSDLTAASAQLARDRSRERIEKMKLDAEKSLECKKRRRENYRKARRDNKASQRAFWCSLGKHHTHKHAYLQEEFAGATICMACQLKIVQNVEAVVELPAVTEAMARAARQRHLEKKQNAVMNVMRKAVGETGEGLVYYMRINGRIKIGYTANLAQRSRSYPPGTELLAVEPGTRELESRRHAQFSRSLAQGREWFAESDAIKEHVTNLASAFGIPTALMHRHTKHEGIKHV